MSGGESGTADDVGTRTRTKTPIEAVADIDHSRVLIIDETPLGALPTHRTQTAQQLQTADSAGAET